MCGCRLQILDPLAFPVQSLLIQRNVNANDLAFVLLIAKAAAPTSQINGNLG